MSLKSGSELPYLRMQFGSEIEGSKISQAELIHLREQVNAAQSALTQLDILVTALQDNVDEASAVPSNSGYHPSSAGVSIVIDLQDMKRSTESLAKTLRKHAPLPPIPSDTPVCVPLAAAPKSRSALYPAPLRLPMRDSSTPTAPSPDRDAPSPFDQEISLLDSQLRQRHSLTSVVHCTKVSAKRPISLPISTFDKEVSNTAHSPHFSTKAKTQRLRSMQQDDPRQDDGRPLSMDELLQFLRKGNSMREL